MGDITKIEEQLYTYADHWKLIVESSRERFKATELDLASYRFIIYNATWCPDCERETASLIGLFKALGDKAPNCELISYEDRAWYKEHKAQLPILGVPTIVVYKSDEALGEIVERSKPDILNNIKSIIGSSNGKERKD